MGWRHRYIQSKSVYEVCFRAREGIPLPCSEEMNFLVECALSWAIRDKSLKISHIVVMGNHIHLLVIVYDPEEFIRFYGELMKRLTDSIKRLVGKKHLRIWEGRAMVALVADPDACLERIKYFYLNPSRAHLSDSIESYPGVSSWRALDQCSLTSDAVYKKELPQILMTDITSSCRKNILTLHEAAKERPNLTLTYHPFAWMEIFNLLTSPATIKEELVLSIKVEEDCLRKIRRVEGKSIISASILRSQKPLSQHTPKKHSRKIFVLSSIKELRIGLIQHILSLTEICKKLYKRWKLGEYPSYWPPGMFRPRAPSLVSLLE